MKDHETDNDVFQKHTSGRVNNFQFVAWKCRATINDTDENWGSETIQNNGLKIFPLIERSATAAPTSASGAIIPISARLKRSKFKLQRQNVVPLLLSKRALHFTCQLWLLWKWLTRMFERSFCKINTNYQMCSLSGEPPGHIGETTDVRDFLESVFSGQLLDKNAASADEWVNFSFREVTLTLPLCPNGPAWIDPCCHAAWAAESSCISLTPRAFRGHC